MATKKDVDRADEQGVAPAAAAEEAKTPRQRLAARIRGAQFLGGVWVDADGTPLNDKEAQAAHRAMDAEAAKAREKALLGNG